VILICCCGAALALPASAGAAGGPVSAIEGGTGVGVPGRPDRYVATRVHGGTLVERRRHDAIFHSRRIAGRYGVPGAAYDGSTTGLSADGRTLVLAAIPRRFPPRRSDMLVLDARRLRIEHRVTLRGSFTVDAVSPDGGRLYLIHYRHGDPLHYEVLAYDVARGQLLRKPIVDPREPDEKMLGIPITRTMSPDGRWAYTLYQRPQDAPFIHALDTRAGTAACIDLDHVSQVNPNTVHLVAPRNGGPLRVVGPAGVEALVDRRTFAVSEPNPAAAPAHPRAKPDRSATDGAGPPWAAAIGALAALLALAGISAAARRRRSRRYDRSASFRNAS
jgi:hypothetical protein